MGDAAVEALRYHPQRTLATRSFEAAYPCGITVEDGVAPPDHSLSLASDYLCRHLAEGGCVFAHHTPIRTTYAPLRTVAVW